MVEVAVRQSPAMAAIYEAITELMEACIKELRSSNKIDSSQLSLERGLFRSFDDIVRRQLDSIWHTVSPRTKQVSRLPPSDSPCLFLLLDSPSFT